MFTRIEQASLLRQALINIHKSFITLSTARWWVEWSLLDRRLWGRS